MGIVTVRELHRNTAAVLEKCEQEGEILIRHRDGREFCLVPKHAAPPAASKPGWPDFAARMRRISDKPVPPEVCALVDKAIRGE
jgi:hypothetical protein